MRHNDLHAANVLVYHTTQESFRYVADGMEWHVPAHGRLVKVIDWGFATSDSLFGKGDTASVYASSTQHVLHFSATTFFADIAVELFDIAKFAHSLALLMREPLHASVAHDIRRAARAATHQAMSTAPDETHVIQAWRHQRSAIARSALSVTSGLSLSRLVFCTLARWWGIHGIPHDS